MTTILKKEWTISFWLILTILILTSLASHGGMTPLQLPIMGTVILLSHLFQTDEKSKMNVYLSSLPIERKVIVRGRYIFLGLFLFGVVTFGFLTNKMIPNVFPDLGLIQQYSPVKSSLVCTIILMLLSFLLPIYYRFTFNVATLTFIVSAVLLSFGLFVFLFWREGLLSNWLMEHIFQEKYVPLALGLAILLFGLSYKVSVAIFKKKELHA